MSYDRELFDTQLKASIELEELRKREKVTQAHSLEVLVKMYTRVIDQLEEELAYEKLKVDAYRMVWSAREYIRAQHWDYTSWASTNHILASALNTLEAERVDVVAIREKYNPKVINLKKRIFGSGGSPDTGVVFDQNADDTVIFDNWHKHYYGPKC